MNYINAKYQIYLIIFCLIMPNHSQLFGIFHKISHNMEHMHCPLCGEHMHCPLCGEHMHFPLPAYPSDLPIKYHFRSV